jgi:transcriptional antiterminator
MSDSDVKGKNKQLCKTIFNQSKIINAQINDTLDSNLHNKKQIMPNLALVSLVDVVRETIVLLEDEAEHHMLKLIYQGPYDSKKSIIKTDSTRV